MSEFTIKQISGDELDQYSRLASSSFHIVYPGFGSEADKAKRRTNETKKAGEESPFGRNRSVLTGYYKGDRLIAGIRVLARTSFFDGNRCEMGGIGGVLSDPEFRKTGSISNLFRHSLRQMYENGQILSHLYPFKTSFYRKYGYEHISLFANWTIPTDNMKREPYAGITRYEGTEAAQKDVREVFTAFSSRYNLSTEKTALSWERYFEEKVPCATPFFSYLHYTEGKPDGFLSYKRDTSPSVPPVIKVMHLYFSNVEALRNLLNFLASLGDYASEIIIRLPADVDLSFLIHDISAGNGNRKVRRELIYQGASRVVDAEKVLKLARYNGRGTVSIKVSDPLCPWNDRCFRVAFDERCISVEDGDTPDAEMTINAFSALILGGVSISDIVLPEGVTVYGNEENLRKVFYRKPCWIEDHF